ncbi:MAG TPA: glycosyltransferase family 87 protein [Pyrinomonadaceae bacterium]|nr:glycosyltransferase family 87 protein [Pyrinomonadaceae bacterium]
MRLNSRSVLLLFLGCTLLLLYRVGVQADDAADIRWFLKVALVQSAIYLAAAWLVIRAHPSRSTLLIVIAFAVLFRLSIVFSPPYLSDDIYRYIWDGRVQAAGVNPYRYVPAAPELAHLRDAQIYPQINRRDHAPTIYPPLAEFLFFLTTRISESVTWMKLTMLGFEVVAVWAMVQLLASLGLARERVLIYAWHPLIVWEFAGSGHVDAIVIAFIALALLAWQRKADVATGAALAGAALIKLFPLVLLPALLRRGRWRVPLVFALTFVLAYLPYLTVGPRAVLGYLPGYAMEQGLATGEQFYLLSLARRLFGSNLPPVAFVSFAAVVMTVIACWAMLRKKISSEDSLQAAMVLATATTVLFAPHYSWYFAWLVPFLCFTPRLSVFYLTTAGFLLYLTWLGDSPDEMFFINSIIYLPFLLIATIEFFYRRHGFNLPSLRQLMAIETSGIARGQK